MGTDSRCVGQLILVIIKKPPLQVVMTPKKLDFDGVEKSTPFSRSQIGAGFVIQPIGLLFEIQPDSTNLISFSSVWYCNRRCIVQLPPLIHQSYGKVYRDRFLILIS